MAGAVAGALGPTVGAAVVAGFGWRWAFFINLPVGIYTVVSGRRHLHESADPQTRVPSVVGVVLIAGSAGLLSYGVVGSEEVGWLDVRTLAVLAAGLVALLAFVVHQRRTKAPALDLELFRIPNFAWGTLAMLVFGTAFSALFFGSILFLPEVWGLVDPAGRLRRRARSRAGRPRRPARRSARRLDRTATAPARRRPPLRRQRPLPAAVARDRGRLPA